MGARDNSCDTWGAPRVQPHSRPTALLTFVPIGAALADFGLFLGSAGAVLARDVGFLLSLGFHFHLGGLAEFSPLESDAHGHGRSDFFVADVA